MCRSDRKRRRRKKRREKRWARNKIWIDRCHLDRHADVTRRKVSSFLDLNIKLLPFSLQILRISILHGRNFNPWSVITNCTRLFRPPLAFHLFSSSFLRFFLSRSMLSASIVRRLLRRIFFLFCDDTIFRVSIFEFSNDIPWRWIRLCSLMNMKFDDSSILCR